MTTPEQEAVDALRARLSATAASVAVLDDTRTTLHYVAATGAGATQIVGTELPVHRGLAGWVVTSGQSLALREARRDDRFAADVAESTGYVPDVVLGAPLFTASGEIRGVLTVLDPEVDPDGILPLREVEVAAGHLSFPDLPAWSSAFVAGELAEVGALPLPELREWAFGDAAGAGVRVAVIDSGVDADHPRVRGIAGAVAFEPDDATPWGYRRVADAAGDLVGHGTACAGIIRSLAPEAEIHSVRVLGENLTGRGSVLRAGIAWAVENEMSIANLSLSSRSRSMYAPLHDVADAAAFAGTVLVSAANNVPGSTYPTSFSSVVSVAARPGSDPWLLGANPHPPVDFGAHGLDVNVAWSGGGSIVASGNSFAAPHVSAMAALIRSRHPRLTSYEVKSVLRALCENARG